jgi:hypothetical protein
MEKEMIDCPLCGTPVEKLTRDHVPPRWFMRRVNSLGDDFPKYEGERIRNICDDCNQKKGGKFDLTHPDVRKYMKEISLYFIRKINEIEHEEISIGISTSYSDGESDSKTN